MADLRESRGAGESAARGSANAAREAVVIRGAAAVGRPPGVRRHSVIGQETAVGVLDAVRAWSAERRECSGGVRPRQVLTRVFHARSLLSTVCNRHMTYRFNVGYVR